MYREESQFMCVITCVWALCRGGGVSLLSALFETSYSVHDYTTGVPIGTWPYACDAPYGGGAAFAWAGYIPCTGCATATGIATACAVAICICGA